MLFSSCFTCLSKNFIEKVSVRGTLLYVKTSAPTPKNVTELKAFLGMLNYHHRFFDRLSTILEPLHKLLRKGQSWEWYKAQQIAFEKVKQLLTSTQVLSHYDPAKPLIMLCDASPYGIAAVLSHRMPNGDDRPIAFASKPRTPAERNYCHIEKEALAIIFGVKKFHEYCFGCFFTIQMDHKSLLGLIIVQIVQISALFNMWQWNVYNLIDSINI